MGGAGKFLSTAERISPKLLDIQQRKQGFEGQKTNWPEAADAPNNLYEPVEYDGGVRGDFVRQSHHRSVYQTTDAHVVTASFAAAGLLALSAMAVGHSSRNRSLGFVLRAGAMAFAGKGLLAALYEG